MDRNNIIGFALIFAVIVLSSIFFSPSKEEKAAAQRTKDSIAIVQQRQQAYQDSINQIKPIETPAALDTLGSVGSNIADTLVAKQLEDKYGAFFGSAVGEERFITVENDLLRLKFSTKGGHLAYAELKEFRTWDSLPLVLFDSKSSRMGFTFFAGNRRIVTDEMYFQPYGINSDSVVLQNADSLSFSMRLYTGASDSLLNKNQFLEFRYTIYAGQYHIGFGIGTTGLQDVLPANSPFIRYEWTSKLRQLEKSFDNEKLATTVYYRPLNDDVDYISESKDGTEDLKTKTQWVSFKQQFFTQVLIARNAFESASVSTSSIKDDKSCLKTCAAMVEIPLNALSQENMFFMDFYLGPTKYKILSDYDLGLERQIPLGWSFAPMAWINRYAVLPVFNALEQYNISYGIIILILTILLKIVLFPIAYKTYMSSAKMKVLKPEVDEISKRYPKKDDALKKQQATMDLYKRAGVNPMAGCIPMLLQLPILIALFRFFPASIELRQQPFLWADDLSSYDSIFNLPFTIPFYGDHVSLFTLLMTISTLIYTHMNNQMMSSTQQMPGMKTMMYLMPIMFLGFFNSYASGLSYYYLLANLITFAQMYAFRRLVNEDKIHARIAENKKKPMKKSGFARRLEEMAKQRGYTPKK